MGIFHIWVYFILKYSKYFYVHLSIYCALLLLSSFYSFLVKHQSMELHEASLWSCEYYIFHLLILFLYNFLAYPYIMHCDKRCFLLIYWTFCWIFSLTSQNKRVDKSTKRGFDNLQIPETAIDTLPSNKGNT